MLSLQLAEEWLERRKCLLNLLYSNAHFLAWQGLLFCRDDEECRDFNFVWLIYLCAKDDHKIVDLTHCKTDKYTSDVTALCGLQQIATSLQSASFFTVMADGTTDMSNVEQVVVCLRWVNKSSKLRKSSLDYTKRRRLELSYRLLMVLSQLCYFR